MSRPERFSFEKGETLQTHTELKKRHGGRFSVRAVSEAALRRLHGVFRA